MKLGHRLIDELRVEPGSPARLGQRSTSSVEAPWPVPGPEATETAAGGGQRPDLSAVEEQDLEAFRQELERAQELLYAADRWALLVVFQGLDAAGKDGTIKHVMSGVNPQGCQVVSFKQPSTVELRHDFLWRCSASLPERGQIGIFNRSHYEEVVVVRVHPKLLEAQRLQPGAAHGQALWTERFDDINGFERHLRRNGTRIVKFFLHVSKHEQRHRLLARLDDPTKQWKFTPSDLHEHECFDDYQLAYEEAITATSTVWAPWYVIPADHKPAMRALVGGVIVHEIDRLDLEMPALRPEDREGLEQARTALQGER